MEQRKIKEKEFHDMIRTVQGDTHVSDTRWTPEMENTISTNPMWVNMKYYAIERKSRNLVLDWFRENCNGKRVLDYCCGNGEDGFFIAEHGAREVVGIDISEISIKNCKNSVKSRNISTQVEYLVADAENTGFENDSFDIVTEYGALHHLDLDKAYAELARILKKDGKAICNEALRHNILIHTYRKLTPKLRTEWEVEHILGKKDIEKAKKYFEKIDLHLFHLCTLFAVPFRNTPIFKPLLSFLESLDKFLLKIPYIKWQAWQVIIILSNPKK